jgi:hypothetical protein
MDSPAIKLYRDTFRLNLNHGFRKDVELTVTDLDLWQEVLTNWRYLKDGKWKPKNPLNIKGLLSEYEYRSNANHRHQSRTGAETGAAGISTGRARHLLQVREGARLHLRPDSPTFAIVSEALRQTD